MRKTIIDSLCASINSHNSLMYPMRGYLYFADIRGNGGNIRRVYAITNDGGVPEWSVSAAGMQQVVEYIQQPTL